jgi:Putative helicase
MNNPAPLTPRNMPNGIPASSVSAIWKQFSPLIDQLRVAIDLKQDDWVNHALPVLENLIRFCHLIPASEAHHHAEIGGLIRHSLEVAIHAMRRSEAFLYGREGTAALQDSLAERWRLAIALGGLLHDIGKPITDLTVVSDQKGHDVWSPYHVGLSQWLQDESTSNYFIIWRPRRYGRHEVAAAFIARELLGPSCIHFLCEYGTEIATALFEALAGTNDEERFGLLIRSADQDSVSMDLRGHTLSPGPNQGRALHELILTYLKRPIQSAEWETSNADCCFYLIDGKVLIDWHRAVGLIRRGADEDGISPFAYEKDELADCLLERGIAVSSESSRKPLSRYEYRKLAPGAPLTAFLALEDPASILSNGIIPEFFNKISTDSNDLIHSHTDSTPPVFPPSIAPQGLAQYPSLSWIEQVFQIVDNSGAFLRDERVCISYPASFTAIGKTPSEALKLLNDSGVIECDPSFPQKLVREANGQRVLVLTQTFSRMLIDAIGKPQGSVSSAKEPPAPIKNNAPITAKSSSSKSGFLPRKRPHQRSVAATGENPIPKKPKEG